MKVVEALEAEYKKERKTGKAEIKNGMTVEKLQAQIEKLNERIVNTTLQLKDKEDNSTVALTTSKIVSFLVTPS
jgi:DNA topoisomerase-1